MPATTTTQQHTHAHSFFQLLCMIILLSTYLDCVDYCTVYDVHELEDSKKDHGETGVFFGENCLTKKSPGAAEILIGIG